MSPNGVSPRVYYIYRRERTSNGVGVNNSSTLSIVEHATRLRREDGRDINN